MALHDWIDVPNAQRLCRHTSGQLILIFVGAVATYAIRHFVEDELTRAFMLTADMVMIAIQVLIAVYKISWETIRDLFKGGNSDAFLAS